MTEQSATNEATSSGRLVIEAVLKTDVGLVRQENQDFGAYTTPEVEAQSKLGGRLMIVADGMGGHRGGATASRLATETVKTKYLHTETADIPSALLDSLTQANALVFGESQANAELRGMGTTTSALVVRGHDAWFGHIGDSRIYLIRSGEIRQLTDDHSLVATMVREGLITAEEAQNHPRRNVLQRSLGVAEEVEADVVGPIQVLEGDVFVLCSDGLHGVVKESEIKEIAQLPIEQGASEFIRRALERGAPDNVTVIVAKAVRAAGEDVFDPESTLIQKTAADEAERDTAPIPAQTAVPPRREPAPSPPQPAVPHEPAGRSNDIGIMTVLVVGAACAWLLWTSSTR
jgi:protein phosphatase